MSKQNDFAKELLTDNQVFRAFYNYIVETFEQIKNKQLGTDDCTPETFTKIEEFCDFLIYTSKVVKDSEYELHKDL